MDCFQVGPKDKLLTTGLTFSSPANCVEDISQVGEHEPQPKPEPETVPPPPSPSPPIAPTPHLSRTQDEQRGACTHNDQPIFAPHTAQGPPTLVGLGTPACKRLISHSLPAHEVIPLIEETFTSKEQIRIIRDLRGDDAQTFVNVIHEVCLVSFLPEAQANYLSAPSL